MKKIIVCLTLLVFSLASMSQKPSTKQEFLTKSKNQKTAAWVLLGGGLGLGLIGLAVGNRSESTFDEAGTGFVLGGIGVVSMISSIPLFIASGRNKRKGMSMALQNEKILFPNEGGMSKVACPSVVFRISL